MTPPPTALHAAPPTSDQRRAAVLAALASAPRLLRFAARITRDLDDAEDAYQRSMEIALRSAPVVEADRFMAWLRTVLRNEAISVAQRRRREGPGLGEDAAVTADRCDATREPTGLEEWRHRYQAVTEAFDHLTDPQRVCIILQARGGSYADICQATGFTRRKVERSILEGRASLRRWEGMVETGEACGRVRDDMDDVVAGRADRGQRRRVDHHVRHCLHCRGVLRTRRIHRDALGALAPACLLPTAADVVPDPGLAAAWFERVSVAASVRTGNAVQMLLDAPGPMIVKAGAALTAAAVAAGVGAPMLGGGAGDRRALADAAAPAAATPAPPAAAAPAAPPAAVRVSPPATARTVAPRATPRVRTPAVRADLTRVAGYARAPRRAPAAATSPAWRPAATPSPPPATAPVRSASVSPAPTRAPAPPAAVPSPSADAAGAASISVGPTGP